MSNSERSMVYRVSITDRAIADADEACTWILQDSPSEALKWFARLMEAIDTLRMLPHRCPLASESKGFSTPVHQMIYGNRRSAYRVLFWIQEEQRRVIVVRIRHCARMALTPDELIEDC